MRHFVLVACIWIAAAPAAAQGVEVGGSLGAGCLGSDGSACGAGWQPSVAVHASWWVNDGIELSFRASRSPLESFGISTTFPTPVSAIVTERSRQFLSGMFVYHFRRGHAVRPMLGVGSGGFARAQHVRCETPGCGTVPGFPPEGMTRDWITDVIVVAGLSGPIGDRWTWRGGWLSHRFLNDENSTLELFAGIGYRFR